MNKKVKISNDLKELQRLLNVELFVVGGYVRNSLLNLPNYDIDIASSLQVEEIFNKLNGTRFLVKLRSATMGTVEIFTTNEVYQHTTFRSDVYGDNGKHNPLTTQFVLSWQEDAKRRDFTINALYLNIDSGKIYDNFTGLADLDNKTIKCVGKSEKVFSEDGLRLLRLVRFASELNFSIDEETKDSAIKYCKNLKDISGERKKKELQEILNCKNKYGIGLRSLDAVKLLFELKLIQNIFSIKGIKWDFDETCFNSLNNVKRRDEYLFCFLLCLFNFVSKQVNISFEDFVSAVSNKTALNFSRAEVQEFSKLLKAFHFSTQISNVRKFIFKNYMVFEKLCDILECFERCDLVSSLKQEQMLMRKQKVPLKIKDLAINGNDLLTIDKINKKDIGKYLEKLLRICLYNPSLNNKKSLLCEVDKLIDLNNV